MVKRIIPGNMSPWECEINDVKYVYPPGTEQMVPDEVAHVIDAWYASQEPKYPEPVQPEGGGGADLLDENGIIKQEYFPKGFPYKSGEDAVILPSTTLELNPDAGAFIIPDALEFVTGQKYVVKFENLGVEFTTVCQEAPENSDGLKWILGDSGLLDGASTTGEPFVMLVVDPALASDVGLGAMLMFAGDSTTLTFSVAGFVGKFSKIDNEYIETEPDTVVVKLKNEGVDSWQSSHTPEQILTLVQNRKPVQIHYTENESSGQWDVFYLSGHGGTTASFTSISFPGGSDVEVIGLIVDNGGTTDKFRLSRAYITVS